MLIVIGALIATFLLDQPFSTIVSGSWGLLLGIGNSFVYSRIFGDSELINVDMSNQRIVYILSYIQAACKEYPDTIPMDALIENMITYIETGEVVGYLKDYCEGSISDGHIEETS